MFDGPMLAAAVVSALAAIPGALRSALDLLKGGQCDAQPVIDKLTELRDHFVEMCAVEASLKEAKEIHDLLHRLNTELESVRAMYRKAIKDDRFNAQAYLIADVRLTWDGIKGRSLLELLTKATSLEYINRAPLVLDDDGEALSGPDWACRFAKQQKSIDQMFRMHDENALKDVHDLANLMNRFINHVNTVMYKVNERIKNEAIALGEGMRECRAVMRQV